MTSNSNNISFDDLYIAYLDCRKKKKNKCGAKKFEPNALYSLKKLERDINTRKYKLSQSQCFIIKYPNIREVFCANFRDRIVHHFIFNELNPVINKMLIYDAANCRIGKGTDFAIKRVARFVRTSSENYKCETYFLKMDLSGFFMRIDRDRLCNMVLEIVNTKYNGKYRNILNYLIPIIIKTDITHNVNRLSPVSDWNELPQRKTLFGNDHGLPIGNLCSQLFANLYLNDLDHIMKSRHRFYSRYVDDIIIIDNDKEKLKESLIITKYLLPAINMNLNTRKSRVSKARYGIPFLGITIHYFYNSLGKNRIGRLYLASSKFKDANDAFARSASRKGMFTNYHGKRLMFRWYRSMPENIRNILKLESNMHFVLIGERRIARKINFIS